MGSGRINQINSCVVADPNSEAVQKHMELAQSLIERMAANSAKCKLWAITLMSAMVALSGRAVTWQLLLIPLILFYMLDAFYLSIERDAREEIEQFVRALHRQQLPIERLYQIRPQATMWQRLRRTSKAAVTSASTLPFYLAILLVLYFLLV